MFISVCASCVTALIIMYTQTAGAVYTVDDIDRYTVPEAIDFPRYNMKCSWENVILRRIFHVVSRFPPNFMLYRGNFGYFLDSVGGY